MKKSLIIATAILLATNYMAHAQKAIAELNNNVLTNVDWDKMKKCADRVLAFPEEKDIPHVGDTDFVARYDRYKLWEQDWQQTNRCQLMIAARHAGYLEGQQHPNVVDSYSPGEKR